MVGARSHVGRGPTAYWRRAAPMPAEPPVPPNPARRDHPAMNHRTLLRRLWPVLLALGATPGHAGEMGHYVAGSWSPRDLLAAPAGMLAIAPYVTFYSAGSARTGNGTAVNGAGGLNVGADSWMITPVIVYAPRRKLLGADWSMVLVPAYGEAGANARLSAAGQNITLFDNNRTGLADTYIVPATLTWKRSEKLSLSAQYSVWAPTGVYDAKRGDNVGLGYWSHDLRGTVSYFPKGHPGTLLSASVVHEFNGRKEGFDLRPAAHTSLELGYSQAFSERLMVGVLANALWETGRASGSDAVEDGRDRLFSVGVEATWWFAPGKLGATARASREFGVRDRFEGTAVTVGFNYLP